MIIIIENNNSVEETFEICQTGFFKTVMKSFNKY